jgi:Tyrosine phosphatase family
MVAGIMFAGLFRRVFEHVRDKPDEPFLIHCFAGMDRTGVLVALMLRIAGVSDLDVIGNEYELTNIAARLYAEGKQMKVSMRWLDEIYGGIEGYFKDVLKFQDKDFGFHYSHDFLMPGDHPSATRFHFLSAAIHAFSSMSPMLTLYAMPSRHSICKTTSSGFDSSNLLLPMTINSCCPWL